MTSDGIYNYTYDEIGNLISKKFAGQSEKGAAYYSWTNGRRLASIVSGPDVYEYKYNKDGIRTEKTINGETITYIVDGSKILKQIGSGRTIEFYYNASGAAVGFGYNGLDYYYGKNLQGDVVELYQGGKLIATYDYDAWGTLLSVRDANGNEIVDSASSTNVASINPIRYRGYYYDVETGMYYLNSRYYNPEICRFINADSLVSTGQGLLGYNMFAYCRNNPVVSCDYYGCRDKSVWSFEHDKQGVTILFYWLFGGGKDRIYEEGSWGTYMRNNRDLNDYVISIVNGCVVNLEPGQLISIDITTSAEIENGESIIGYHYLHGTNADVGGFRIEGTVGKDFQGNTLYDIKCTWNDIIDPNYIYPSDKEKAEFAYSIPFVHPKDYKISITWGMRNPVYIPGGGKIRTFARAMTY